MPKNEIYDAMETKEGLSIVRKRPGQFVGSPKLLEGEKNSGALIQLFQEILSNSIDEAYAGHGSEIVCTIHKDNSVTILDHGRGMPMGDNFDKVIRGLSVLYSSGKYDDGSYANPIGQNGVGVKAVNALSDYISVKASNQAKQHYSIKMHMEEILEKELLKPVKDTYTEITFLPDSEYFDGHIDWEDGILHKKLELSSYLTPKVKFVLNDERNDSSIEWYSENGLVDFLTKETEGDSYLIEPIPFHETYDDITVEGAISFVNGNGSVVHSFANGVQTSDGGTHVNGYYKAIFNAISEFAQVKKILKKNQRLDESDVYQGLVGVVQIKLPEDKLVFNGQIKSKLQSPEGTRLVKNAVEKNLLAWLYDNVGEAERLVHNVLASAEARVQLQEIRKTEVAAREKILEIKEKKNDRLFISKKLRREINRGSDEKPEVYFVEGDSALGSIIAARMPYQAVLPLRGKVQNVFWLELTQALKNEEISTMVAIIGTGMGEDFNPKELHYDKFIIAADADEDGGHIVSLLLVFFWKFYPELIIMGKVYVAVSPFFRMTRMEKGKAIVEYAYSIEERDAVLEEGKKKRYNYSTTRFKGLGEADGKDLRPAIMDPNTRHLVQLSMPEFGSDDMEKINQDMDMLMGTSDASRKEWMKSSLDFTQE